MFSTLLEAQTKVKCKDNRFIRLWTRNSTPTYKFKTLSHSSSWLESINLIFIFESADETHLGESIIDFINHFKGHAKKNKIFILQGTHSHMVLIKCHKINKGHICLSTDNMKASCIHECCLLLVCLMVVLTYKSVDLSAILTFKWELLSSNWHLVLIS